LVLIFTVIIRVLLLFQWYKNR